MAFDNGADVWQPKKVLDLSENTKRVKQSFVATAGQTEFEITDFAYLVGAKNLDVFHAGSYLDVENEEFTESSSTSFLLKVAASVGDIIVATAAVDISGDEEGAAYESALDAEAERMTADSYATEAEDAFVKVYTSNGDGTFTATNTTEYSSLHYALKSEQAVTATNREIQTATAGQTVFTLTEFTYEPDAKNIVVYVEGIRIYSTEYEETNSTTITFSSGITLGEKVLFVASDLVTNVETPAYAVEYLPAGVGAIESDVQTKLREVVSVFDFMTSVQIADVKAGTLLLDVTAAIQAAIDAVETTGGTVYLPRGIYLVSVSLSLKDKVSLIGDGFRASIIDFRGTGSALVGNESIIQVSYKDFAITNANNTNANISGAVWNYGLNRSHIKVKYTAKASDTSDGFVVHGTEDDDGLTANNAQYGCIWDVITESATECTGTALKLNGKDVSDARCNGHHIKSGVLDGFSTGLYINGNGNLIGEVTVNGAAATAGVHFYGDGTFGNVMLGVYLDSGISGDPIRLESTTPGLHMVTILEGVDNLLLSDVNDVSGGGNSARFTLQTRARLYMGEGAAADVTSKGNSNASLVSVGTVDDIGLFGIPSATGGGVIVSGESYAAGVNAVSDSGGVTASIGDGASAEFRVCSTANGSSFNPRLKVSSAGKITLPYASGNITLTGSVSEVQVTNANVTSDSMIIFAAQDPSAGVFIAGGGIHVGSKTTGSFYFYSSDSSNFAGTEKLSYIIIG